MWLRQKEKGFKYWGRLEETGIFVHCSECNVGIATMEDSVEISQKRKKINTSFDSAFLRLGIHPKQWKTGSQKDIHILMFVAVLVITTKT